MIGIIGAMRMEIEEFLSQMSEGRAESVSEIPFHIGKISGVDCVVALCGPGKVNAALCTQIMILKWAPSLVINTGVAGGIGQNVKIGDLVLAESLVQHDVDTSPMGDPIGMVSGLNMVRFPASAAAIQIFANAALETAYSGNVHTGVVATGDQFIAGPDKFHWIAETFGAISCEMEGASIAQVCYVNKTPCAVIRAISDNADSGAHVDFMTFAESSAHKITALLCKALPSL